MAVFFHFSIIIKQTEQQRLSQQGHKNRLFKQVYFNYVFCEICFLYQFLIPPTYSTAKYVFLIFVAIAIAVFCVQLVK